MSVGRRDGRGARRGPAPAGNCWVFILLSACAVHAQTPRPADELPLTRLKADAVLPFTLRPGAVATSDALLAPTDAGVVRVGAAGNDVAAPVLVGQRPCASLAAVAGHVWVPLCAHHRIARIDEKTSGVGTPVELDVADAAGRIAAGVGSLWVASSGRGIVSRVDPDSGQVVAEIRVAADPSSIVFADDALWITSAAGDLLTHVNAHTNQVVETVKVGPRPGRVAVGEGAVWTLNRGDGSVSRVDPKTHKVEATIAASHAVADGDIAVGEGAVWVSASGAPLVRIDPKGNRVAQRFTGSGGGAVAVAHGSVWIAVDSATWRLDPILIAAMRP
jgi:streptogramin lyase